MRYIYALLIMLFLAVMLMAGGIWAMFFAPKSKPTVVHMTVRQKGTEEHIGGGIHIDEHGRPSFDFNLGVTEKK